jgi:hypothetical protein
MAMVMAMVIATGMAQVNENPDICLSALPWISTVVNAIIYHVTQGVRCRIHRVA